MVWGFSTLLTEQVSHLLDELMRFHFHTFKASRSLLKNLLQDSYMFRNPGKSGLYRVAWWRTLKLLSPFLYFQHICTPFKSGLLTQFLLVSSCTERKQTCYLTTITNYRKHWIDLCGKKRQSYKVGLYDNSKEILTKYYQRKLMLVSINIPRKVRFQIWSHLSWF